MTVKEYLRQAGDIEKQIHLDMLEACRLRALAEKCTTTFAADRTSGGMQNNRIVDAVMKLSELENEIIDNIHRMVQAKRDTKKAIGSLRRPEERMVLTLRYIEKRKWERIAVEMNYSWKQIHRIHYQALRAIEGKMTHNDTQICDIV